MRLVLMSAVGRACRSNLVSKAYLCRISMTKLHLTPFILLADVYLRRSASSNIVHTKYDWMDAKMKCADRVVPSTSIFELSTACMTAMSFHRSSDLAACAYSTFLTLLYLFCVKGMLWRAAMIEIVFLR